MAGKKPAFGRQARGKKQDIKTLLTGRPACRRQDAKSNPNKSS